MLSDALHFDNVLGMLPDLLTVGTPNRCLWQDDIGQEPNLIATILEQSTFCLTRQEGTTGHRFLD